MTTIVQGLDKTYEGRDSLYAEWLSLYLEGECYAFAMALHGGLGWQMVGLMEGNVVRHAAVRSPENKLHDVRGFVPEEEFGNPFLSKPHELREISCADLLAIRPVHANSIAQARRLAEAIWPELPWKETLAGRLEIFTNELEALSRKYNVWIRAAVPASPPVLSIGDGGEAGYRLHMTLDATTYTIDRYFG